MAQSGKRKKMKTKGITIKRSILVSGLDFFSADFGSGSLSADYKSR